MDILEPSVLVGSRSSHHHVCCRRLASARAHKRREDCDVQDIPRVEEGPCCMGRKLREPKGGLLRSDKSTGVVDSHVSVETSQRDCERVIGRGGRQGGGCEPSASIRPDSFGAETYHCKRPRLGYPALLLLL